MKREYTAYQRQAIEADGCDICVAAGAGSGKTGVLVERFVRLVTQSRLGILPPEQRAGVDEILVVTFTEKATKEMKTRIVEELTRLGLIEERRRVETAYISTIHGFCSRLLQENPFEAGVDPQFSVLEESQAKRLLRQTFEEVIAQAYLRDDREIMELVAAMQSARQFGEEGGDPLTTLANSVEMTLAKLRGAGRTRDEAEKHWLLGRDYGAARSLEPVWALLSPVLDEITACMRSMETLRSGLMGVSKMACESLLEQSALLRGQPDDLYATLAALKTMQQAAGRARPRPVGVAPQEIQFAPLIARIKTVCQEASLLFDVAAAREEQASLQCHRLWGLALRVWEAYDHAKRARGKVDNDDLQAEGVRLLTESTSVRRRYQRHFRHLMLDEFQDTNPLQMRLVELLHGMTRSRSDSLYDKSLLENGDSMGNSISAAEISNPLENPPSHPSEAMQHRSASNLLFIVGDIQQSIYGFRNADSSLFRSLERQYREGGVGQHIPLAVNFRSRPEILRLIEQLFHQVWREAETPFVPLSPGADFDPKPTPSVELLLSQNIMRRDYARLEADALAARIQQMVEGEEFRLTSHLDRRHGQPVSYRDIAILLRGLTDIQKYEEAFARRGVPYFVVGGGRGYYARHEIRDLLNVLTVLDTPLDDVALAAVLRSPLVGADVDTLYRLSQLANSGIAALSDSQSNIENPASDSIENRKSKIENSTSGRSPLYPALKRLLESHELPAAEREKLAPFLHCIESLRDQEDRLPVGHLLERLISTLRYDARLLCRPGGRRRLANVRKLLQMANADSVMGVREFIRRLRDLEKLSDREGDAPTEEEASDVVRFLTIHGAKGLEFPVVVLADLSRSLEFPERGLFVCDPHHLALGTKLGGEPNLAYKAMERRRQVAERQETERLLYVAMTRAREHLILCGNIGRNRGYNWGDLLFQALGVLEAPPEPEVQSLVGGLSATVAPLSHYVHAPLVAPSAASRSRRHTEAQADRIATALLNQEPLSDLFS